MVVGTVLELAIEINQDLKLQVIVDTHKNCTCRIEPFFIPYLSTLNIKKLLLKHSRSGSSNAPRRGMIKGTM